MNTFDLFSLEPGTHTLDDGTRLEVTIVKPGAFSYKSGEYTTRGYQQNTVVSATWTLPNGVEITARNTADRMTYRTFGPNDWTRRTELTKKTRVYVWSDAPFDVLEDLENRRRRPHQVYRPLTLDALRQIGLTDIKLNWSQNAGCSCGCSPGFIVTGDKPRGINIWVTLPRVPTVDDTQPGRDISSLTGECV